MSEHKCLSVGMVALHDIESGGEKDALDERVDRSKGLAKKQLKYYAKEVFRKQMTAKGKVLSQSLDW